MGQRKAEAAQDVHGKKERGTEQLTAYCGELSGAIQISIHGPRKKDI